jgi:hypothetical protein
VLVVAMDNKPLKTSGRILVQVGTTERPAGWKTRPVKVGAQDGEEIVDFGKAPWMIQPADVTVTIRNALVKTAIVLDPNGMPGQKIPLAPAAADKTFKFPADALYVVLE